MRIPDTMWEFVLGLGALKRDTSLSIEFGFERLKPENPIIGRRAQLTRRETRQVKGQRDCGPVSVTEGRGRKVCSRNLKPVQNCSLVVRFKRPVNRTRSPQDDQPVSRHRYLKTVLMCKTTRQNYKINPNTIVKQEHTFLKCESLVSPLFKKKKKSTQG